ncbi:MAG: AAA family ATPase [Anaeroplasmataceae bacterium]|nr:AAA family ATPase [Anaeroplasmataceae bacterium]
MMEFKRKVFDKILDWKENWSRKYALFLRGARRVGKTTLAEKLCKEQFKTYIKIDFREAPLVIKNLFLNNLYDLDSFFLELQTYYNIILYPNESVILFDEIQLFPKAREAITMLVKDGRYSYVETGSLASIKKKSENIVIPSEELQIDVFPLDFEEFLWALKDETTMHFMKNAFEKRKSLGQAAHQRIMNLWRKYILIGGMPQAVLSYVENNNFQSVDFVKQRILDLYRDDVAHQKEENIEYIQSIIDVIPSELSKHDKRFVISHANKNARLDRYLGAFNWLSQSYIANFAYNANDPNVALSLSVDDSSFKCYMGDTGLLISLVFSGKDYIDNTLYKSILFDRLHVNEGMIIENAVAQAFKVNGKRLFFYSRRNKETRKMELEVDFLIERKGKISPVEVKSSILEAKTSLKNFKIKFNTKIGESFVLWDKDIKVEDNIIYLPLYMATLL